MKVLKKIKSRMLLHFCRNFTTALLALSAQEQQNYKIHKFEVGSDTFLKIPNVPNSLAKILYVLLRNDPNSMVHTVEPEARC